MPTFYLVGLMYFDGCERDESRALLPNGTRGGDLPPHYASFFIEKDALDGDPDWWANEKISRTVNTGNEDVEFVELRIPVPSEVTFPTGKTAKQCVNFEKGLPKLQRADPQFEPDFTNADSIAEFSIDSGTLEPRSIDNTPVVVWNVSEEGRARPYEIRVREREGKEPRIIKMKAGAEAVFSNTPDFFNPGPPHSHSLHSHHNHFELFGKISTTRDGSRLVNAGLTQVPAGLVASNGYLQFLDHTNALTAGGGGGGGTCSGGCCGT